MQSDLEIARAAKMEDISAIAWKLGIGDGELMPMGIGKAKITWDALKKSHIKAPRFPNFGDQRKPNSIW